MKRLQPGSRLGAYQLVERLGAGATAEVWRAVSDGPAGFRREVVLKRPLPELGGNAAFMERLAAEARLSVQLDHPCVVRTLALETLDGVYTLVLELVRGRDLRTLLRAQARVGPPEPGLAAFIVQHVCRALAYAHDQGIVHRDVSPANVLLGYGGAVKLSDFGLAKPVAGLRDGAAGTGVLVGTLPYMAPEQLAGGDPAPAWDIYAAGVVLHETLVARRLFKGANDPGSMAALRRLKIDAPSRANPAVPPELDAICARALSYRPEERYASAGEMAAALETVARAVGFGEAALGKQLAERVPPGAPAGQPVDDERMTMTAAAPERPRPRRTSTITVFALLTFLGLGFWLTRQPQVDLSAPAAETRASAQAFAPTSPPSPVQPSTTPPPPAAPSTAAISPPAPSETAIPSAAPSKSAMPHAAPSKSVMPHAAPSKSTAKRAQPARRPPAARKPVRAPDLTGGKLLDPFRP